MPRVQMGMPVFMTAIDFHRLAGDGLPVPAASDRAPALPAPPRVVDDLVRDLSGAAEAVRAMPLRSGGADVTVAAYTAVVCNAATTADALQQAADWCRQAPRAEVHALAVARAPGHREDIWEYSVTLTVSFPDDTGGHTGQTHHGCPRR
ncbi:hypothetical protein ACFC1R_38305 [Kitasatospora sp. NPDC056138]|uniref:hypothetical protein n=1 Tax=Kitasatospora sp. NPDC056138 TaxID=3345724 RepID=UPI0035D6FE43